MTYPIPPAITKQDIENLALINGYEYAALKAVIIVESTGRGFSETTGRIIIQFEPTWFKRSYTDWKKHQTGWQNNGLSNQTQEWTAFNAAFAISPDAAMKSTSIGMMQVMGFNYRDLGFKKVGEMWDFAKKGEYSQLKLGIRFIKNIPKLDKALKAKDWSTFAYYYNGSGYKELAIRTRSLPYDLRMANAYKDVIQHGY